jgi:hypothetical protein
LLAACLASEIVPANPAGFGNVPRGFRLFRPLVQSVPGPASPGGFLAQPGQEFPVTVPQRLSPIGNEDFGDSRVQAIAGPADALFGRLTSYGT